MPKDKTIDRLFKAIRVTDEQIDLVDRILDLESDNQRIYSINLFFDTVHYGGIWADVILMQNFRDLNEFKNYLSKNSIPTEYAWKDDKGDRYSLKAKGILAEFYVPDMYPKKK